MPILSNRQARFMRILLLRCLLHYSDFILIRDINRLDGGKLKFKAANEFQQFNIVSFVKWNDFFDVKQNLFRLTFVMTWASMRIHSRVPREGDKNTRGKSKVPSNVSRWWARVWTTWSEEWNEYFPSILFVAAWKRKAELLQWTSFCCEMGNEWERVSHDYFLVRHVYSSLGWILEVLLSVWLMNGKYFGHETFLKYFPHFFF